MEALCVSRTVIDAILKYTGKKTNFGKNKLFNNPTNFGAVRQLSGTTTVIIIIIYIFNCKWAATRWQWL